MKKISILSVIMVFGVFCIASLAYAKDMTNLELAQSFVRMMGAEKELSDNYSALSGEQQYSDCNNILSGKGFSYMTGLLYSGSVTRGLVANILYDALNPDAAGASVEAKIDWLAKRGIISAGDPNEPLSREEILQAFNNPLFVPAFAESYEEPASAS